MDKNGTYKRSIILPPESTAVAPRFRRSAGRDAARRGLDVSRKLAVTPVEMVFLCLASGPTCAHPKAVGASFQVIG